MKIFKTLALVVALLAGTVSVFGQSAPVRTTLSAAVADAATSTLSLTSTAGMTASTSSAQTYLFVVSGPNTGELMRLVSTSPVRVSRAAGGKVSAHVSGANVFYGVNGNWDAASQDGIGLFLPTNTVPAGAGTRNQNAVLPMIHPSRGSMFNVLGGKWVEQTLPETQAWLPSPRVCNVPQSIGTAAILALATSVTGGAGTVYVSSTWVPTTRYVTGLSVLNGGTVGTSLTITMLYDSAGTLLSNAATGGISGGTASLFWDIAFTTPTLVTGPARYFVGVQNGGATATFSLLNAAAASGEVFGNLRAGTLGTLPSVTVPTAFSSVQTPVGCLY